MNVKTKILLIVTFVILSGLFMGCSNDNIVENKQENIVQDIKVDSEETKEETTEAIKENVEEVEAEAGETETTGEIEEIIEVTEEIEEIEEKEETVGEAEEAIEEVMTEETVLSDEELVQKLANLSWAQDVNQVIMVVEKDESRARLLYLEKTDGYFEIVFSTLAWIGSNGMGKTKEGDCKTPAGVYSLSRPFGRNDDPGCQIPYVKLDDSWYWVEDGDSQYYNQMVSTNNVEMDWSEAEQLNTFGYSYNYSIAIDFNKDRVPGVGSAIFLHCTHNSPTRGCVAIEEELMTTLLQRVKEGAVIALYPDESAIE